jgi:pentatricopeptide repeat protein
VEAYIERCDTVCAWKTLVEASVVYSWTSTVNKRSYVPLSVVRPFIYDLRHKNTADPSRLGDLKHIDYLRDRMNHVEFPEKGRGYIIGRMMTAALTEFKGRTADPTLALKLYEEYTSENGAAYNCRIPFISHIAAIKSYGLNGDMKSAQILFNRVIDESYDNELDAFIALIHGYSLNQQRERTLEVFEQMKKEGVELSVSIYEAVLAVAPDLAPELAIVINSSAIIPCLVKHPNVVKCLKDNGCDIIPKMLNPNK